MMGQINPQITAIWDVSNAAMSDTGGIDQALMKPAEWSKLAEAATRLERTSQMMAKAKLIRASLTAPDPEKEAEPGVIWMSDIQHHLDADPDGFRALAEAFSISAGKLADAAQRQDALAAGDLLEQVNAGCETCHTAFWYPPD